MKTPTGLPIPNNEAFFEVIKSDLVEIKDELNILSLRMQTLENELSFLKGKQEGFGKFKDVIYIGYMFVMTGVAAYAMFWK